MAKKTIERPQGGIQLNNKEDKSLINATPCMNFRVVLSEKNSVSKGHILWFHLYHIVELTELQRYRIDGWFPGVRMVVEDYKKISQDRSL